MAIKFLSTVAVDTNVLYVDAASNRVGIGTTSPARQLTLSGNASPTISLKSNTTLGEPSIYFGDTATDKSGRLVYHNADDYMVIWTNGNESIRVTSKGDTGIGTTQPYAKLEVAGGVKVADDADEPELNKVGTLRYRKSGTSSYVDMCMQTDATAFKWVNIVENSW
tara:strand:+ start:111 stop:608 length:498 start_codon:yes stop_codon:yes gene_type:complete